MTGWLILAAYLAAWIYTTRHIAIRMLDQDARRRLKMRYRDEDEPLVDTEDRILALFMGAMVGLVWPIAALFLVATRGLRTPTEAAEAQRRELEVLRKLAREHNLPMPREDA